MVSGPIFNTLFMVMVRTRVRVMVISGCDVTLNMSTGAGIKTQTVMCFFYPPRFSGRNLSCSRIKFSIYICTCIHDDVINQYNPNPNPNHKKFIKFRPQNPNTIINRQRVADTIIGSRFLD